LRRVDCRISSEPPVKVCAEPVCPIDFFDQLKENSRPEQVNSLDQALPAERARGIETDL